jgi:hypothetical protein
LRATIRKMTQNIEKASQMIAMNKVAQTGDGTVGVIDRVGGEAGGGFDEAGAACLANDRSIEPTRNRNRDRKRLEAQKAAMTARSKSGRSTLPYDSFASLFFAYPS